MEFKGSKGKWFSSYINGSWLIQDLESYQEGFRTTIAEVYYFNDGKDTAEANALLISKSPEMLEMLKECYKYLPYEGVMRKKVDNLIKQATEL